MKRLLILIILLIYPVYRLSSKNNPDSLAYKIETGAIVAPTGGAPFWLGSNNYGIYDFTPCNVWLRASLVREKVNTKKFDIIYGLDAIERYSDHNDLFLHQAWLGIKLGAFIIKGGKWEEVFGNQDKNISSGGLVWSGNASPVPQIEISIPEFTAIPFSHGYAEIKGGIAHGWLGDNSTVQNILLHHKYLYFRFGGPLPVNFQIGIHHFAQWGGISSNPDYGTLPNSFSDFIRVFFARGGSPGAYWTEYRNATGNHIGSYNLGIKTKFKKQDFDFYWQTIFEDGSGMRLKNVRDGLWGLKISFKSFEPVSAILVEYINTTDQSGSYDEYYVNDTLKFAGGNDNYFNSAVYPGGWSYRGKTIGTPLITSPELMPPSAFLSMVNNKITAFHLGIEGRIENVNYEALYTFSENYGSNANPFPHRKDQHSILLKSTISNLLPSGISASVAFAFDLGNLLENNAGFMISLRKEGIIRLKPKIIK